MKQFFLPFVCAFPLLAIDNSVTIRDNTGAELNNLPFTVQAVISRGEIANYARPAITIYNPDGNVYTARTLLVHWQADIKTRWRDASANRTITAVTNPNSAPVCPASPTPCTVTPYVKVTAAGHPFRDGEEVTISGSGTAEINGTWTITDRTDDDFALAGLASVASPGSTNGIAAGPDNGSWATGEVSGFIPSIPANGWARIDFVNDPGSSSDILNTGLTKTAMLARTWDFEMTAAMPVKDGHTASYTANARTMLTAWDETQRDCGVRIWNAGPVLTEVILEDNCHSSAPPYDFGWTPVTALTVTGSGLPASQSDGTQTFDVTDASDLDLTNPVIIPYSTGSNPTVQLQVIEWIEVCSKSTNTLTVCNGGRGKFGSTIRTWPSGAVVAPFQGRDAASDDYKHFHPAFHLRFYTTSGEGAYGGVRARYILNNNNPAKPLSGYLSIVMKSSVNGTVRWRSGLSAANIPSGTEEYFWMQAGSRMAKIFWDGIDPDHYCSGGSGTDPCTTGTRARKWLLDPNLDYKMAAGFIQPFDRTPMDTGSGSPFEAAYNKFLETDKADAGTLASLTCDGATPLPWSIRILGYSYYSTSSAGTICPGSSDATREEGWIWSRTLSRTLPVLGTEARAWEILFGTSITGGAGIQAAEHHLPINWVEGSNSLGERQFSSSTCTTCTGFGRPLSLDVRPTIYLLDPETNSNLSPAEKINYAAYSMSSSHLDNFWYSFRNPGPFHFADTYLDAAHRLPHSPYLYLITGDYYDLMQTQNWASWLQGFKNPNDGSAITGVNASQIRRRNWAVMIHSTSHARNAAWPILANAWAAALTPNVPQFGNTYAPPERFRYEYGLTKSFQVWEGMKGLTTGKFPPVNSTCEGITWNNSTSGVTNKTTADPWCFGRLDFGRNSPMPDPFTFRSNSTSTDTSVSSSDKNGGNVAVFNGAQLAVSLWQGNRLGLPMFRGGMFTKHMQYAVNVTWNKAITDGPGGGLYLTAYFVWPWINGSTPRTFAGVDGDEEIGANEIYPSLHALRDSLLDGSCGSHAACENPTMFVGSSPGNEVGYAHYWRVALAAAKSLGITDSTTKGCRPQEKPPNGCTGSDAYDYALGFLDTSGYTNAKRTAQIPATAITNVAATPDSDTVTITYTAPDTSPCTYTTATAISSSLDTDEPSDGGGAVERTLHMSGLTGAGTSYTTRITCGLARSSVTYAVTTSTESGGEPRGTIISGAQAHGPVVLH